jgi:hypothetical protein
METLHFTSPAGKSLQSIVFLPIATTSSLSSYL